MIDLPAFDALALSLHHSPGVHAILVGSGLSERRISRPDGRSLSIWSADWRRGRRDRADRLGAMVSRQTRQRAELLGTPARPRQDNLRAAHDPSKLYDAREGEDIRAPTRAHQAIAQLAGSDIVRVVITTNFDRLIENAMREAGVEPTIIASADAIRERRRSCTRNAR